MVTARRPVHDRRLRLAVECSRQRKKIAQRTLRDQRQTMASAVAGQMAHDFNNLLAPLITYAELLKMQLPDGHPGVEHCDAIIEITDQMAATIESARSEPI